MIEIFIALKQHYGFLPDFGRIVSLLQPALCGFPGREQKTQKATEFDRITVRRPASLPFTAPVTHKILLAWHRHRLHQHIDHRAHTSFSFPCQPE